MVKFSPDEMETAFRATFPGDDRRIVHGEGPVDHPRLMLIGEAPGAQEALLGRPFVGKAGKNLDEFLETIGLDRVQIRISNVVKVRPSKVSAKGTVSNRPPNREELAFFTPYLLAQIEAVRPSLLVTLGNTALQALLGKQSIIGDCHGAEIRSEQLLCPVFPLYHPASIIYNRSLANVYHEDLLRLKALLNA